MAALQQGRDQQKAAHRRGLEGIEQGGFRPLSLNVAGRRMQRQPAEQQHEQQSRHHGMQHPVAAKIPHQRSHQSRCNDESERATQPHLAVVEMGLHHHAGSQRLPHRHQGRVDEIRHQGQAHQPPEVMAQIKAEESQQTQQTEQPGDGQQVPRPLDLPHHHQVAGEADRHPGSQQQAYHLGAHADPLQPERPERQIGTIDEVEGAKEQG